MQNKLNIWLVSREYDGIAEAGGVKNVTTSLAENLSRMGNDVTVFIPLYACSNLSSVNENKENIIPPVKIKIGESEEGVSFNSGEKNGVKFIFISSFIFNEKRGVYTYTAEDEMENREHVRGTGHHDSLKMNVLFQKAVIEYSRTVFKMPDVIHCQDATAALVPVFALEFDKLNGTKFIVTIHNAGPGYHHEFYSFDNAKFLTGLSDEILKKGMNGNSVEPFLLASLNSEITTVSPQYAEEIMAGKTETQGLSKEFKKRRVTITGITNGIDFEKYTPQNKSISLLPYEFNPCMNELEGKYKCRRFFLENYAFENAKNNDIENVRKYGYLMDSPDSDCTYISYHGRIVTQKGIDILCQAAANLMTDNRHIRFIFMGQGEQSLETSLAELAETYRGRCVYFWGYERALTRLCTASADFAVFPSKFEPCGLEDFIAQIYGTLPVAHATGGLCKIIDEVTGFLYKDNNARTIVSCIRRAYHLKKEPEKFQQMIKNACLSVKNNYSWANVITQSYMKLYK